MSTLVTVNRFALERLCAAAMAVESDLRESGADENADELTRAAADLSMTPVPQAPFRPLSNTREECEWIAARVHELWHDPVKVCEALDRLFSSGSCESRMFPDSTNTAQCAARRLREGKFAALGLLMQSVVQSRLTDLARDEFEEREPLAPSPATPYADPRCVPVTATLPPASPLAGIPALSDHNTGSADLSSKEAA